MRRFTRHLTFSNTVATMALVMSLTGSAYAAVQISGANLKNNSVTGAKVKDRSIASADIADSSVTSIDVKNGSLSKSDLSATAQSQLKGAAGPQGDDGPAGPAGAPAKLEASYASEDMGRYSSPTATQNTTGEDWYVYDNEGGGVGNGTPDAITGLEAPTLTWGNWSSNMFLIGLTDGQNPGGYLNVDFDAAVSGTASITLVHHGDRHLRAECSLWMVVAGGSQSLMGDPVYVSSNNDMEVISVALVGTKDLSVVGNQTKVVDVQARCRDADYTTNAADQWEYVRGNITAFAASEED